MPAALNPEAELAKYGVPRDSVLTFSGPPKPRHLDYLDFVDPQRKDELRPDGVAESQDRPLLFFVDASHLAVPLREDEQQFVDLRRRLACRGQRTYLAVVRAGQLDVWPVNLDDRKPEWKCYEAGSGEAVTFFSRLALGEYGGKGEPRHADYVFDGMFKLLEAAGSRLAAPPHHLKTDDVLSLIGRALFFRFLCDRQIVKEQHTKSIAPQASDLAACFDTVEDAAATCRWLDKTFNGDFLPLTDGFFERTAQQSGEGVFAHLGAIARRYQPIGGGYQPHLGLEWTDFDFAHVPVGLLSQVYETFSWKWDPSTAQSTSVHYTPRNIARTLVGEVFDGLPNAAQCRVLDPACGGGVLLARAFRELYRARWNATGERPDTQAIRDIMQRQLTGFDISESAIRLAALSLYLTAIELDPDPEPPAKLKFAPLRETVLFNLRRKGVDPETGPIIGCLGEHVSELGLERKFDVVVSNPPWTALPGDSRGKRRYRDLAKEYTKVSRAVIERRGASDLAGEYDNPGNAPDLPILWRSTEWCKPGGRIAVALHARVLLKQEDIPKRARETFLRLVEVTGILNGSNVADTRVWPDMSQPFLLLFARNQEPRPGHAIRFITTHYDASLNRRGEVHIDSKSAIPVDVDATSAEPWLWKAVAVGSALDVAVVRKLSAAGTRPLLTYWKEDLGLESSNGYQVKPKQPQDGAKFLAKFLQGLPDLNSTTLFRFLVDAGSLSPFSRETLFRPHRGDPDELAVYRAPLVLVKECPGGRPENGRALLAFTDLAYNDSFHGYSGCGHPEGELLVRYVHLFVHSTVWMHYVLLTSPKFGAERRRFYKSDLDDCPIVPLEQLHAEQKRKVLGLSKRLAREDTSVFDEIDALFANLYGLDKLDLEVIADTLAVSMPYREARNRACRHPSGDQQEGFRVRLRDLLRPFFRVVRKEAHVALWKPADPDLRAASPFGMLLIGEDERRLPRPDEVFQETVLRLASDTGQALIIEHLEGGLLVAIRKQYRYWTQSRARLCAAQIVRRHLGAFEG